MSIMPTAIPRVLTAAALDGNSALVTWRDTNTAEGGYRLAYGPGQVNPSTATYVDAPEVDTINGAGFFTVRGLGSGTRYCFRVMAFNNDTKLGGTYCYSLFSEAVCAATVAASTKTVGAP